MSTRHDRRERERDRRNRQREREHRRRRASSTPRIAPWMGALAVAVAAIGAILLLRQVGVFEPPPSALPSIAPPAQEVGTQEPDGGSAHVERGQRVAYTVLPPTSGNHWALPHAGWGVKDQSVEDELVVHNLEHGGIAVQYKPDIGAEQLAQLRTFVRQLNSSGFPKVLLRPYRDMNAPIVATAWRWRLELQAFDQTRLQQFVVSHYGSAGNSPEPNAG